MKTLVVGSGAVGCIIGGYLACADRDITLADGWFQHIETIRSRGLAIEAVDRDFNIAIDAIHLDQLANYGQADVIIVASKSYDTRMMALLARENMHTETIVMSAQNGMNDDAIASTVGDKHTVACVVAFGADLHNAAVVRRTTPVAAESIIIGHLWPNRSHDQLEMLRQHFEPLGGVRIVDDIWPERWAKLILNSMSNGLAGLTGLMSNALWSDAQVLDVIVALGHETALVAAADGVEVAPVLGRISHRLWLDASSKSNDAWAEIIAIMREVSTERTGSKSNRASLLQDVLKGRRTEIAYLNGWVCSKGALLGVDTPAHAMLVDEVQPIELTLRMPNLSNVDKICTSVRGWYA